MGSNLKLQQVLCVTLKRSRISNSSSSARRSDRSHLFPLSDAASEVSVSAGLRQPLIKAQVLLFVHPTKYLIKADAELCKQREEPVVSGRWLWDRSRDISSMSMASQVIATCYE